MSSYNNFKFQIFITNFIHAGSRLKTISGINFKFNDGFTLIELMAVFSIVSIVTGMGIISLVGYSRSQVSTQAAADIKQAIETARFNALSSVKPASCFSVNPLASYTVRFCINNPNCIDPGSNLNNVAYQIQVACLGQSSALVSTKKLPKDYVFTSSSSCLDVKFNSLTATAGLTTTGAILPSGCTLVLHGYGPDKTVTISQQGYVSY